MVCAGHDRRELLEEARMAYGRAAQLDPEEDALPNYNIL
jgi:Flp pilus assembly protein TadD